MAIATRAETAHECRTTRETSTLRLTRLPRAVRLLAFWEGGFGTFTLPMSGRVAIGRLNESGIRIDHPSVSRQHAELLIGPPLRVVDLGSFNGTRVGGVRIQPNEPTVVLPHTVIEVGSTLLVVEGNGRRGERRRCRRFPREAPDPVSSWSTSG